MKIKNQLILTIVAFFITLLIINVSIFYAHQQQLDLANKQVTSGSIQSTAGSLNIITDEYLVYQQDSFLAQWASNITSLHSYVADLNPTNAQQSAMINNLTLQIQQTDNTFNETVLFLQNSPSTEHVRENPEFQSLWSQLSIDLQTLSNSSSKLTQLFSQQNEQSNNSETLLIVASLFIFAAFFLIVYLIMFRNTLYSIRKLQKGIEIIGTGNLDYSVETKSEDEIGYLSKSINQMTIQLKEITTTLKEQERMVAIGQTAGMVGHDLRNPLQSIVNEVYIAETELKALPDSERKKELELSIRAISEQTSYMDKIVSDLQTFVKAVDVHKEMVDLNQLITGVLVTIDILPTNIQLVKRLQNDLNIYTDPQLTKRVLINLITNAIQAMPNGGTLTITANVIGKQNVRIMVEDTGTGIADEVKPKIFTPLFTTKSMGQGFGLAVCKRVIEAQGGTIAFESEEGKGTIFTIQLPLS